MKLLLSIKMKLLLSMVLVLLTVTALLYVYDSEQVAEQAAPERASGSTTRVTPSSAPDAAVETAREEVLGRVEEGEPSVVEEGEPSFTELPVADSVAETITTDDLAAEDRRQHSYLQQLSDPSPQIRAAAAKKIEARDSALEELTYMIRNDPSPEVRIATTWSLEKSEDPVALAALIDGLNDADNEVVMEIIDSLEFAGDESTVEHLEPFLEHPDARVRARVGSAINYLQ
jgi:hypothetical protein